MSTTVSQASLWPRLAQLPLKIESYELDWLEPDTPSANERVTSHIRLQGDGEEGLGEEISLKEDQEALHEAGATLPLAGEWTLESFSDHLATVEQWTKEPEWEAMTLYRNWAYESAALDLALRQGGKALHEVLELEPKPLRFLNSLGLGDSPMVEPKDRKPPTFEPLRKRVKRYPDLRYKLDAEVGWTDELIAEVVATGAVEAVDLQGLYGFDVDDVPALVALYERVLAAFPEALLEDPHDLPEIAALLEPHVDRVTYDSPVHRVEDIPKLPLPARTVNVKPCRTGGLRPLFDLYAYCEANGIGMYGGGMGELGVGRGQIQLLASLFHPDTPNDVAPGGYNADDPPEGLPSSPLPPKPENTGFRSQA